MYTGTPNVEKINTHHWRLENTDYVLGYLASECAKCGETIPDESAGYIRDGPRASDGSGGIDELCFACGHEITGFGNPMSSNTSTTDVQSTDRDLPDDQLKIKDEDEYGESELQTMERAVDLSKQFEAIKNNTVEDGMVLGELTDINTSENNSRIVVKIDLPAEGMPISKRFRKPKRWSEEYAFVRWIRHYGYDAYSFPQMLDDKCKVKVEQAATGGDYEVFVPDGSWGLRARASDVSPIEWYMERNLPVFTVGMGLLTIVAGVSMATTLLQTQYTAGQEMGIFGILMVVTGVTLFIEDEILEYEQ